MNARDIFLFCDRAELSLRLIWQIHILSILRKNFLKEMIDDGGGLLIIIW